MNEALRAPSPPPKRHTPGHCSFTGENKRIIFLHTFLKAFWLLSRSDTTLLHPAAECWSCAPASFKSHVLQPAKRLCRDFSHYMVLRLRHTWKCICTYDWTSAQDDLLLPLLGEGLLSLTFGGRRADVYPHTRFFDRNAEPSRIRGYRNSGSLMEFLLQLGTRW